MSDSIASLIRVCDNPTEEPVTVGNVPKAMSEW